MPAEFAIVLAECLRRLDYPRAYRDPIIRNAANNNNNNTGASASTTDDASSTMPVPPSAPPPPAPYYEYIDREARPPFTILPTKQDPHDDVTREDIRRVYVERALVPLRAFRAEGRTIDEYNRVHMAYLARNSTKVVTEFVRRLGAQSMFQLQIIYAFAQCVNNHCRVYTFPLPTYLERPINALLCREHRIADVRALPPHASRTAVCTHCHRAAVFVETARKRNMASAIGTDRTKLVTTTVNERAILNVMERGALLAPDQCNRAPSLYKALARRAFRARSVLDDVFNDDPVQRRLPSIAALPTEDEERAATAELLEQCMAAAAAAPPAVDARTLPGRFPEYEYECGAPRPPMYSIGQDRRENAVLAMIDYERELWREYSRRTPVHKLLLGHNIASAHRDLTYDVVRYTDNPTNFKSEVKKQSRAKEVEAQKDLISDPVKRAARERSLQKSRRANVLTYLLYKQCSESAMYEFDRRHGLVSSKVRNKPLAYIDFYMCCCVCGVSGLRSEYTWRGAMLVCKNCVTVQPSSSTSAVDQALTAAAEGMAGTNDGANIGKKIGGGGGPVKETMHNLLEQYAAASASVLFDSAVPDGAQCIIKGCLTVKSPLKQVYGKEVFDDTRVGAERFRYVYVCAKHAADRSWIFAPSTPAVMPLSMLLTLCFENRGRITERDQEMNHLPRYMEQLSQSLKVGRGIVDAEAARRRAERETKRREEVAATLAARGESVPETAMN
jgi:translation initiation factor 2 beta subunit (eIF-2beta)/eIF-5